MEEMRIIGVRLLDQVRHAIRTLHYSRKTEHACCYRIRLFTRFHSNRYPRALNSQDVSAFLTLLAVHRKASASTQNQVLNAILFLYRQVLEIRSGQIGQAGRVNG